MSSIVVEYSLSQKAFHRQTVGEMLSANRKNVMERRQTDYVPIAVFETVERADEFIDIAKDIIKDYPIYLTFTGEFVVGPF